MKLWKKIVLGVVGIAALAATAFVWKIGPRNVYGMLRYDQRREGDLRVGGRAPDVSLVALDGRTPVRIGDSIGAKPLVIVFGSYT
jgi:hypothetical protein